MKDKVSIVIPCFNCENTIAETLSSLDKQTFKNFEVLCINDGSTDKTLSIILEIKDKGSIDIKIFNQDNHGVSFSRNIGIKEASGDYIVFLDADDVIAPEYLDSLLKYRRADGFEGCYCRLTRDIRKVENGLSFDQVLRTQYEVMHDFLNNMSEIGFYCFLYVKDIVLQNNLLFDESTKHFEDREFAWKYLANIHALYYCDAKLYGYRINKASALHKKTGYYTDSLDAVKRIGDYLAVRNNPFHLIIMEELYPRCMWSLVKTLSAFGKYEYIKRLRRETDVDACMKTCSKNQRSYVKLFSYAYRICPFLFFVLMKVFKFIMD